MRAHLSLDRFGWLYRLDCKKLIIIVFLLRLIVASAYDIYVTIADKDTFLPDSRFYSVRGRYVNLLLEGYDKRHIPERLLPHDRVGREIFITAVEQKIDPLPYCNTESNFFSCILGLLYYLFGYATIWARVFNICLSMLSVYLLFRVTREYFGTLAANLFLLMGLFIPTQFGYSIMLCRDLLRLFFVSVIIWVLYGGYAWVRKQKQRFCF